MCVYTHTDTHTHIFTLYYFPFSRSRYDFHCSEIFSYDALMWVFSFIALSTWWVFLNLKINILWNFPESFLSWFPFFVFLIGFCWKVCYANIGPSGLVLEFSLIFFSLAFKFVLFYFGETFLVFSYYPHGESLSFILCLISKSSFLFSEVFFILKLTCSYFVVVVSLFIYLRISIHSLFLSKCNLQT